MASYRIIATLPRTDWRMVVLAIDEHDTLFSASGCAIRIWQKADQNDATSYACIKELRGHDAIIRALKIDQTGRLFSGSDDNSIKVWQKTDSRDARSYECAVTLTGHTHRLIALDIDPWGRLFSASEVQLIRIWQMTNPHDVDYTFIKALKSPGITGIIKSLRVDGCGNLFVASYGIHLWQMMNSNDPTSYVNTAILGDKITDVVCLDSSGNLFSSYKGVLQIWGKTVPHDPTSYALMATSEEVSR